MCYLPRKTNMRFSYRCRYWVIIQVAATIILYRGNASGETAQGCVGSRLDLQCPSTQLIKVVNVHLGISGCKRNSCCIEDSNCTRKPSGKQIKYVRDSCDGQQTCSIETIAFGTRPCVDRFRDTTIDGHRFERITYSCAENVKTSTNGTTTRPYDEDDDDEGNKETDRKTGASPTPDKPNSQKVAVVLKIIGIVNLQAMIIFVIHVVVVIFRRKKREHPVAMAQIDNSPNDIYANETDVNSPHENEVPAVYSQVEERTLGWNDRQSDRVTRDQTKVDMDFHSAGPDVYAEVPATSSALKTDWAEGTGLVKTGDYLPEEIYSLASEPDIYANEPTSVHSTTRLMTGAVSKASSPQDEEDQTVIDNDLYCH